MFEWKMVDKIETMKVLLFAIVWQKGENSFGLVLVFFSGRRIQKKLEAKQFSHLFYIPTHNRVFDKRRSLTLQKENKVLKLLFKLNLCFMLKAIFNWISFCVKLNIVSWFVFFSLKHTVCHSNKFLKTI